MRTFKDRKVFISGGNGVIGNCLVRILHEQGAILFVGDLKPRPADWPADIYYREGDLNYISCDELLNFGPEYYFHLAATFERSVETYEFWQENFHHNIRLSNHLMTCMKDCPNLLKVIFASSYLIYNPSLYQFVEPRENPCTLKEDDEIYPRNLTGVAKLLHEIELRFLSSFKRDKYKVISARIFRGHGLRSKDIISRWVRSLLNNEPLIVYRKEGMFDYIFSEDSAEGLARLALSEEAEGVINLGTGRARKVADVLSILKDHFPGMSWNEVDSDILFESSEADISLLKRLISWSPSYSLEESIASIIKYERQAANKVEVKNTPVKGNVLVTSISAKVPLVKKVKEAINKTGTFGSLYGGDVDANCIGKYFVDVFWNMPYLKDEHINEIETYCKQHNIRAIIPTRDGELLFWSRLKKRFSTIGISVMVSDELTLQKTIDKLEFANEGKKMGFPVIPSFTNLDELTSSNVVVKERFGAGSRSISLNISKETALAHSKTLEEPIFQPFVAGKEFSVDLYVQRNGKVKGVICRTRVKVVNGESQITETHHDRELAQLCSSFAESLKLFGHALFQVLQDDKGDFYIIECNSRFGGASSLSVAAGLDSFFWFLLECQGTDISSIRFNASPKPLRQIRFSADVIESLVN